LSHDALAAPRATHVPRSEQTSPPRLPQSASVPHAAPAAGTAAHVPHVALSGTAQYVLAHCAAAKHVAPIAPGPASDAHAAGGFSPNRSAHDSFVVACAQPSKNAGVAAVAVAASPVAHVCSDAATQADWLP
jgi:hypothetical protein